MQVSLVQRESSCITQEISAIKEKSCVLHWDNRNGGLKARPPPHMKTPFCQNTNSFERRELDMSTLLKAFPAGK